MKIIKIYLIYKTQGSGEGIPIQTNKKTPFIYFLQYTRFRQKGRGEKKL